MNTLPSSKSGSVLITAIIFGVALTIAVAGYVYLASQGMRVANRTFHMNSAMNLAEAGIDEGLHVLNVFHGTSSGSKNYSAWTNWTTNIDGDGDGAAIDAKRTFSYFSSNQGTTGEFTVIVTNWDLVNEKTNRPKIIVRARSTIAGGGTIEKYVRATTSRRSFFNNGLVARYDITFSGNNVSANSYDSLLGPYEPDLSPLGTKESAEDVNLDGIVNRFDNVTVASSSIEIDSVNLGNADIWGQVATGGDAPDVGPNGTIADFGQTEGTVNSNNVSTDFQANFPPPPDIPGTPDYVWATLPTTVSSGTGWRVIDAGGGERDIYLGVTGSNPPVTYFKLTSSVDLGAKNKVFIEGPVIMEIAGNFDGTGNGSGLYIQPMPDLFNFNASGVAVSLKSEDRVPLRVWVAGNFKLAGQGLTNPYTIPAAVQIYGTAPPPTPPSTTGTQDFYIKGNGDMAVTTYAPNADLTIVGNGNVNGAFVANSVTATGNAAFHYDEALAQNGTGAFSLALWRELRTSTERAGYNW